MLLPLLLQLCLPGPAPRPASSLAILSQPTNITRESGQAVSFPCKVNGLSSGQQTIWRRGTMVLATGPILITLDRRFSVTIGRDGLNSLRLEGVRTTDNGTFVCQVGAAGGGVLEVEHRLSVQVAPSVAPVPPNGRVTATEGETVSLHCNATGVPEPRLAWQKSVGTVPGRQGCGGTCYTIPDVQRGASGDYICSAVNGVGHPAHATLTLTVLYPPIVSPLSPAVSGTGLLSLGCKVSGEPPPTLDWFKDGQLLRARVREQPQAQSDWDQHRRVHSLTLKESSPRDFGNYSCVASNLLGTDRAHVELHGRPSSLAFLDRPQTLTSPHYRQVLWTTTSRFPVVQYTLLYRKADALEWATVLIPGDQDHFQAGRGGPVLESSWILKNLTGNTSYECIVQAQNQYGWSLPSQIYEFHTAVESTSTKTGEWRNLYMRSTATQERGLCLLLFLLVLHMRRM